MSVLRLALAIGVVALIAGCGSSSPSNNNQNQQHCTGANALSCGAHGTCDESSGTAACVCATGYAGADCSTCATGFQDKDHNGTCAPACAASTCGANGTCDDSSGAIACTCATGYAGAACDTCASGYQDKDGNGTCAAACSASTCGSNGTCDDSTGTAVCTCTAGYTGAACETCDAGFQDNDHNGTCEAACTSTTCDGAAHFACDDSSGTASCGCAHGYADDGSGGCAWSGILKDPGFDNTPAGAWSVSNGVIFSSAAQFDDTGACTAGSQGVVSQGFTLPDPSVSEPLDLSVYASATCSGSTCSGSYPAKLALEVAGKRVYSPSLPKTSALFRFCAGEAAYQPGAVLSLEPADRDACNNSPVAYAIQQADFAPDSACPPLGSLSDGDFSTGGSGWSLTASGINGGASATVESAGVIDGSPDAHLHVAFNCSSLSASVPVSVPFAGGTAIHFDTQLTAGEQVNVQLDGATVGTVIGTGGPQSASMCLPKGLSGWVHSFSMSQTYDGTCTDSHPVDLYVDNVSLVSDPSCAGDLIDPGAEADGNASFVPWSFSAPYFGGTARFTQAASEVHGGSQAIELQNTQQCGYAGATVGFTYGAADANGGPALKFWYLNDTDGTTTSADVVNTSYSIDYVVPQAATWQQGTLCTPPERAGMADTLRFGNQSSGSCGNPLGSTQTFVIDDLQVTTDPSCPKN